MLGQAADAQTLTYASPGERIEAATEIGRNELLDVILADNPTLEVPKG